MHILSPRTFRTLADLEFYGVALTQIVESLAIHRALMKEVLFPRCVLDEPESFIDS